jgi:hypothetical protein
MGLRDGTNLLLSEDKQHRGYNDPLHDTVIGNLEKSQGQDGKTDTQDGVIQELGMEGKGTPGENDGAD